MNSEPDTFQTQLVRGRSKFSLHLNLVVSAEAVILGGSKYWQQQILAAADVGGSRCWLQQMLAEMWEAKHWKCRNLISAFAA